MPRQKQKEVAIVTGSSGLIGSAVTNRLAEHFDVVGFDREGPPHPPPTAECVCVDLTSKESVQEGLKRVRYGYGERIASVLHLAAYYDFSGEPSPKYQEITVRGTERLLRALKSFYVEQFVFSSTMLVHAPCEPGQRINEDWPLDPRWDYPQSKVETEQLILAERGETPAVLLRIAGVYDDLCHSIPLAHQIQRIYERRLTGHVFPGHISHGQAFLHLDDLTDAFLLVAGRRAQLPPELVLLLGEAETLSYDELQHTFGRLIHSEEWDTREIPKSLAKAGAWFQDNLPLTEEPFIKPWMIDFADDHYALDITRAGTVLDWEPKRSLRDRLPKMVAALKADPPGWYRKNKLEPPQGENGASSSSEGKDMKHKHPQHKPNADGQQHKMTGSEIAPDQKRRMKDHKEMPSGDHLEMTRQMREKWLWTNFTIILLGLWLVTSPFTFGYTSPAMRWSDVVSGVLLALFAGLALFPRLDFIGRWSVSLVGIWLQFAPLVFWAPTAVAYVNDTLVGALAITLSILVPMMPGMAHHMVMMKPGPEIAPGWSYNPSSWHQRAPMIALAFIGWLISRYLAAFQLGYSQIVWEPFFRDGTVKVLTSEVSRMWPISDAGLGAVAYTFEMLMAWMGGRERWRTMPWMVTFFFILVVPLGLTHIALVILQPVVVGYWCSLCLAAALLMLLMIPFTVDEVIAMGQFLSQSVLAGKPFWRTFWVGDTMKGGGKDHRTRRYGSPVREMLPPMVWGVTTPWNLVLSAALGVWLMFAPAVFGMQGRAADSDHVVGALVVTVAVIATAEVVRAGRFLNVLFGAWVVLAPWLLGGASVGSRWNGVASGAVLVLLSLPRGKVKERYGRWDAYVF